MINILSIRCALAFAPYLIESVTEFLDERTTRSRVVRQGGNGLIIRPDGHLLLRHEGREAALGVQESRHYRATTSLRAEAYAIKRMQDEVVIASFGKEIMLSHPQSDLWLEATHVTEMLRACREGSGVAIGESSAVLPDWMNISAGEGRLLISDQRNGRWVLLGSDHLEELERRLGSLDGRGEGARGQAPPVIPLKGINIHLQSAFKLAATLETFADTGEVVQFEEAAPSFTLSAARSVEGVELRDSEKRIALTAREARKWADIIRGELERLNASQVERGAIRTVYADADGGRWVLQWGDEVFVPDESLVYVRSSESGPPDERTHSLRIKRSGEFLLLLSQSTGACVALSQSDLTSF